MNNRVHPLPVSILRQAAEKAYQQGFFSEAQAIAHRAFDLAEKTVGLENQLSLDCARDIVLFSQEAGDVPTAQTKQEVVLSISRKLYGTEHPIVALHLRTMADLQRMQGKELEARRCEREAAAILSIARSAMQQDLETQR